MLVEIIIILATLLSSLLAAYANYVFKKAKPYFDFNKKNLIKLTKNKLVLLGGIFYIFSLIVYLFALKFGQLSYVYPISASTFIFVFIISGFVLREKFSAIRALGATLIFVGILIIALTY
ncbi:MAG: EamA family transporter [Candidatus Micrarchaeaceae archaeon]